MLGLVLAVLFLFVTLLAPLWLLLAYDWYRGQEIERLASRGNALLDEVRRVVLERFDLEASGLQLTGWIEGRSVAIEVPEFEAPGGPLPSASDLEPNFESIRIAVDHDSNFLPENCRVAYGHPGRWTIGPDAREQPSDAPSARGLDAFPEPYRSFFDRHRPAGPVTDEHVVTEIHVDTGFVERFAEAGPDARRSYVDALADDIEHCVRELADYAAKLESEARDTPPDE